MPIPDLTSDLSPAAEQRKEKGRGLQAGAEARSSASSLQLLQDREQLDRGHKAGRAEARARPAAHVHGSAREEDLDADACICAG